MKEIPIPYVRANQAGIVLFVLLSILLAQPWLIVFVWAVQLTGLLFGLKANLFVFAARPFLAGVAKGAKTEAAELARFNNSIAVGLLSLALLSFAAGWTTAGYVFAALVAAAAFVAICGFCVGCFIYFQFKQMKARRG